MKNLIIILAVLAIAGCGHSSDETVDSASTEVAPVVEEIVYGELVFQCTPAYNTDASCSKECLVNYENAYGDNGLYYSDVEQTGVYTHPGGSMYEGDELTFKVKVGTYQFSTQVIWTGCNWREGVNFMTIDTYSETITINNAESTVVQY